MRGKDMIKRLFTLFLIIMTGAVLISCSGSGSDSGANETAERCIHVAADGSDETGDGSEEKPFATPAYAATQVTPGTEVIVHGGTYGQFSIEEEASGTESEPVVFRAAEGEEVVIESVPGDEKAEEESIGIHLINVENITVDGFEVTGGTHGIYYDSLQSRGEEPLENISIRNCSVHGVRGTHGICVYARNDYAPVKNIVMEGCEVYDCECFDSESTVLNGNIDGFTIRDNMIHDNNNIGIDMIGFEGTAVHNSNEFDNPYDADYVRNGECYGNTVYNISSEGNDAYLEDGEYDLCANGIYVDGGQNIKIHDNFIFNCDIGLEIATEHSPEDNELFKVSGIELYDNVVAGCMNGYGMCFGGYDADLGFTEDCSFHNNTFADNGMIGVQRSSNNTIYDNIFVGDNAGLEFNPDCREEDLVNEFGENIWCFDCEDSFEDRFDAGDYDLSRLIDLDKQQLVANREEVLDGFRSLEEGKGSSFVPDEKYVSIYESVNYD